MDYLECSKWICRKGVLVMGPAVSAGAGRFGYAAQCFRSPSHCSWVGAHSVCPFRLSPFAAPRGLENNLLLRASGRHTRRPPAANCGACPYTFIFKKRNPFFLKLRAFASYTCHPDCLFLCSHAQMGAVYVSEHDIVVLNCISLDSSTLGPSFSFWLC